MGCRLSGSAVICSTRVGDEFQVESGPVVSWRVTIPCMTDNSAVLVENLHALANVTKAKASRMYD